MPTINRQTLDDAIEESGLDITVHDDYSGRAMFGRRCVAVSGSIGDLFALAYWIGRTTDAPDLEDMLTDLTVDQFGRGFIVYFPGWELDHLSATDR